MLVLFDLRRVEEPSLPVKTPKNQFDLRLFRPLQK